MYTNKEMAEKHAPTTNESCELTFFLNEVKQFFKKEDMKVLQISYLEKIRNTTLGQEEKLKRELRKHRERIGNKSSCNKFKLLT